MTTYLCLKMVRMMLNKGTDIVRLGEAENTAACLGR
ncbi:hypothetical protein DZA65_02419 [Dickeya dianthicola]|nr:hypothetical protein DZA65_02419 [Dickeya dianthicola]